MTFTPEVRSVIESGRLAHFTTVAVDGRPHTTIVWVGLDGDEIVIGKLHPDQKPADIRRDPRVSVSMEADGDQYGMQNYMVVEGTARITDGGAPELLRELAQRYIGPGAQWPPDARPPTRVHHPGDTHQDPGDGSLGRSALSGHPPSSTPRHRS